MKKFCIILLLTLCCSFAHGQTGNAFQKGDNVVGLSVGLGGTLYSGGGYSSKMPLIALSYERCLMDNLFDAKSSLGLGAIVGYTSSKWKYAGYGWKYTNIIVGLRGALHYQFVNKLDTYTGLMLGYDISSAKTIGNFPSEWAYSASTGGFAWAWNVGARYYFTDSFAGFAELGYGVSILNVGVAFKF